MMRTAALMAAVATLGCAHASEAQAQPVVDAPAGAVRGEALDGVNAFRGIPYAEPPVGWRRWRPPASARKPHPRIRRS